jgi:MFS transporter
LIPIAGAIDYTRWRLAAGFAGKPMQTESCPTTRQSPSLEAKGAAFASNGDLCREETNMIVVSDTHDGAATAATHRPTIDVSALVERQKLGGFAIGLIAWCFLIVLIDGYDQVAVAYSAPALIAAWHTNAAEFGHVFGFGLFGVLVGSLLLGFSGDRFGRRRTIIYGTLLFGVLTLASARASSLGEMTLLRFLAGIGMGGVVPNTVALRIRTQSAARNMDHADVLRFFDRRGRGRRGRFVAVAALRLAGRVHRRRRCGGGGCIRIVRVAARVDPLSDHEGTRSEADRKSRAPSWCR